MSLYKLIVEMDSENLEYYKVIKPILFEEEEKDIIENWKIYYLNDNQLYVYITGLLSENKIVKLPRNINSVLSIEDILYFEDESTNDDLISLKKEYIYKIYNKLNSDIDNNLTWFNTIIKYYEFIMLNNYFLSKNCLILNEESFSNNIINLVNNLEDDCEIEDILLKYEEIKKIQDKFNIIENIYTNYKEYIDNINKITQPDILQFEEIWNKWLSKNELLLYNPIKI